jgi:hypothetical protein
VETLAALVSKIVLPAQIIVAVQIVVQVSIILVVFVIVAMLQLDLSLVQQIQVPSAAVVAIT